VQGLRGGHVDTIGEGSHDQSGSVAQVLVGVPEAGITYLALGVIFLLDPVKLQLRLPLELFRLSDILVDQ